jgi:hypothetical protein
VLPARSTQTTIWAHQLSLPLPFGTQTSADPHPDEDYNFDPPLNATSDDSTAPSDSCPDLTRPSTDALDDMLLEASGGDYAVKVFDNSVVGRFAFAAPRPELGDNVNIPPVDFGPLPDIDTPSSTTFGDPRFRFSFNFNVSPDSVAQVTDMVSESTIHNDPYAMVSPFGYGGEYWSNTSLPPFASSPRGDEYESGESVSASYAPPNIQQEYSWLENGFEPLDQPSISTGTCAEISDENRVAMLSLFGDPGGATDATQQQTNISQDDMEVDTTVSAHDHSHMTVDSEVSQSCRMTKIGILVESHNQFPVPCSQYMDKAMLSKWPLWPVYTTCLRQTEAFPSAVHGLWHMLLFRWMSIEMQRGYLVEGVRD